MSFELQEIHRYQVEVATGWIDKARMRDVAPAFVFIGSFMAFNALYWYWGVRNNVSGDIKQVQNLVQKLDEAPAAGVLAQSQECIETLTLNGSIRNMRGRSSPSACSEGVERSETYVEALWKIGDNTARLKALGVVLYHVRCNLIHGSKTTNDRLPGLCAPAIHALAEACLTYTIEHRPDD